MLKGKHILIGISGGIAAYKVPELIRLFTKAGAEVRVTSTRHALEFVTEMTLQTLSGHSVYSDVFAAINEHATEHISLPEWADIMLVAPATANVLGKTAAGIADDALTTTLCSCVARRPVVIAPAMNDKMWENPAVQKTIATLRKWEHVTVLEPEEGPLACGTSGKGRMPEADFLFEAVQDVLTPKTMSGKRVLITAGPTQEKIDPVRYLSNYSTGKMGFALARECVRRGAEITLVSGPTAERIHNIAGLVHRIDVQTAQEMHDAAISAWPQTDIAILCAAVADFTPEQEASEKIKKQSGQEHLTLSLRTTPDIAAALGANKQKGQRLIGFALETQNEEANAMRKLTSKHMDAIVLNSLRDEGAGFGTDTNRVTILTSDGRHIALPLMSKADVAKDIVEAIVY